MKSTITETFGRGVFNTLAQNGTIATAKKLTIVKGVGANIGIDNKMKEWAKRKTITQFLMLSCIEVAQRKKAPQRVKQYWNTYHCMNEIVSANGRIHGKYCKNRFCTLCQSIRKAKTINQYYPVMKDWKQAYFVTLTIKAVKKKNLKKFMAGMVIAFQRIKNKYKKQSQRGTGWAMVGVRTLECNYNPEKGTYNPHFHLIVKTEEMAELLVAEWLKIWTSKWAGSYSQDIKKVENMEERLIECIKYGTKIFTDPEPSTKKINKGKRTHKIFVSAFDNINAAMDGLRLFDRFGFNLPHGSTAKEPKYTVLVQFEKWKFEISDSDWFSEDIEAGLSGYSMPYELENLLTNDMDQNSE